MSNCKNCNKELNWKNLKGLYDVDHSPIGLYCKDCFDSIETNLKESRFIEEYKSCNIYCKDNKYYPYWDCHYYFNTIEGVRDRIDHSTCALVPNFELI